MPKTELAEILALERKVWAALITGDAGADAALLDDRFLGVYETGYCDKAGHVGQLADGPTVASYDIDQTRLMTPAPGLALLCYRASFMRAGARAAEAMYVSSLWQHTDGEWRNIFSQDTGVGTNQPV